MIRKPDNARASDRGESPLSIPASPDAPCASGGPQGSLRERSAEVANRPVTWTGLGHLLVVYLVWGSTYLAIRMAVREGSGFPPFLLGGSRTLAAALALFAWNAARGQRILPCRHDWKPLVVTGLLLWLGGNGLVNWAEQRADSGYAALLVGAMPIWVVLLEALVDRRRPSPGLVGALIIGFLGLATLTWPVLRSAHGAGLAEVVALIIAPLSWGAGAIYLARQPPSLGPTAGAAWQQLAGAAGFLIVALIAGEPRPHPTPQAWGAWGYLVVAGSIIAFTSFVNALRLLPTSLVTTYSYVNPVIAVFLGWLVLHERITAWTVAGTILILAGVAGAFHEKQRRSRNSLIAKPGALQHPPAMATTAVHAPGVAASGPRVSLDKSPARVRQMFDDLASRYDRFDTLFSLGLDRSWRKKAVRALNLRPGDTVLDAATGTGELALAALRAFPETRITGIDFARRMLGIGREKLARCVGTTASSFVPVAGDALSLPFRDGCFDAVMIAYGLRNTQDTTAALDEFRRVLKGDGKLLVLEFGIPTAWPLRGIFRFYFHRIMPRLAHWSSGHQAPFAYLASSVEAYPNAADLAALIESRGFAHERTTVLTGGITHAVVARAIKQE